MRQQEHINSIEDKLLKIAIDVAEIKCNYASQSDLAMIENRVITALLHQTWKVVASSALLVGATFVLTKYTA